MERIKIMENEQSYTNSHLGSVSTDLESYFEKCQKLETSAKITQTDLASTTFHKRQIPRFSVALALVGMFFLNSCKTNNDEGLGTYSDPKIALIETYKALTLLSQNLNKGYENAAYLKEYETTKDKIFNVD